VLSLPRHSSPIALSVPTNMSVAAMLFEHTAADIKVSIEVRIEADSEDAARQYAAKHGIDVDHARWSPNGDDKGGRLYAASTIIATAGN
jgi:hypothetical protein